MKYFLSHSKKTFSLLENLGSRFLLFREEEKGHCDWLGFGTLNNLLAENGVTRCWFCRLFEDGSCHASQVAIMVLQREILQLKVAVTARNRHSVASFEPRIERG